MHHVCLCEPAKVMLETKVMLNKRNHILHLDSTNLIKNKTYKMRRQHFPCLHLVFVLKMETENKDLCAVCSLMNPLFSSQLHTSLP